MLLGNDIKENIWKWDKKIIPTARPGLYSRHPGIQAYINHEKRKDKSHWNSSRQPAELCCPRTTLFSSVSSFMLISFTLRITTTKTLCMKYTFTINIIFYAQFTPDIQKKISTEFKELIKFLGQLIPLLSTYKKITFTINKNIILLKKLENN